uniref:Uncharacterized protein n=1 Tax=Trichogramma kaykai TaxID=54128 RepID=A0ABD2WWK9_9HYME
MSQENQRCANELGEKVDPEIDEKSHEFLRQLYSFISDYEGQLPNLRDIFRPVAIEWLLTESIKKNGMDLEPVVNFLINTGYKDEPDVGDDGKPLSRRTTPLHHAVRRSKYWIIPDPFKIYDRFDVNYTDDYGYTHFHIACEYGRDEIVVKKFLDHGQDPNCIVPKIGDSPLHLALRAENKELAILLLRNGADPNLANSKRETSLHGISELYFYEDIAKVFFEISDENHLYLQVNARDSNGDTPLHIAMQSSHEKMIELLLRNGADPNMVNNEGSTPLHFFIVTPSPFGKEELLKTFFRINGELNRPVQVDAKDKLGRTPLQLAVIMKIFPQHTFFKNSANFEKHWVNNVEFATKAKEMMITSSLSLRELVQLRPKEAAKLLTLEDYYKFERSNELANLSEKHYKACSVNLSEKLSRGFFRRWSLDPFMELTHYQLPILCCEIIIDKLMNQGLYNICLAAAGQTCDDGLVINNIVNFFQSKLIKFK